jgi:hypothetical protein
VRNSGRPGRGFYRRRRRGGDLTRTMARRATATALVRLAGVAVSGDVTEESRGSSQCGEDEAGRRGRAARTVWSRAEHGGGDVAVSEGLSGTGEVT